ncbi:MAG TPA: hypothetical protein VLT33_01405, partial [Labilithrix sp.]|nr:hypothetical protein [Labilithrix sp.]
DLLDEALVVLPRTEDLRLAGGRARFDAHAELAVEQRIARGSVHVNAARLGVTKKDLRAAAGLKALARVHDWSWERGDLAVDEASVGLTNLAVTRGRETLVAVPRVAASARSARLAFDDPFAQIQLKAAIEDARVTDPLALNAFIPPDSDLTFDTEPGDCRLSARLTATVVRHVGRASASVRGRGLGVRGKKVSVRGNVDASADIADWSAEAGTLRVIGSDVVFGDVAVRIGERDPAVPSPAPDVVAKRVALSAAVERLDAKHPSLQRADYHLVLEDADMADIRPLSMLVPGDPFAFAVESGKARAAIDVFVKSSDRTASGSAVIDLVEAGVRMRETHLVGDFRVVAPVRGFDPALDGLDVSGSTVTMKNVRTAGAKAEAVGWSGEVTLVGGAVRVSSAPAFDGLVQLHFDDAKPILALTIQNSLPSFVVGMLKAPALSGQARISVESGRAAILGARARGGNVALAGSYVVAGANVRGALTVAKGALSAGVKFDDAGTSVRLFQLDSWMKEETSAVLRLFDEAGAKKRAVVEPR